MKEKQEEQKLVCADKKVIERVLGLRSRVSQPRQILRLCISQVLESHRTMEPKTPVYLPHPCIVHSIDICACSLSRHTHL